MAAKKRDVVKWVSALEDELEAMSRRLGITIRVTAGEAYDEYLRGATPKQAARAILARRVR